MADISSNALSGLLAQQRALATVGQNIANATTEGYTRQRIELSARPPVGRLGPGNGVEVATVRRQYDAFLTSQLRETRSLQQQLETFNFQAGLLDDVLADPQGGITPALQAFYSAVQELSDDPASGSARVALLNEGEALVSRFHYLESRMRDQARFGNQRIEDQVNEINALASSLVDINIRIQGATGGAPAELLDQRDQALLALSEHVAVSTIENANGMLSVFIGTGQSLVDNANAFTLGTAQDPRDATQLRVVYNGANGTGDITDNITGGELGGMLDYQRTLLPEARNSLGRVALAIAETFNDQHREGMDLSGALGGDFFTTAAPQVAVNANNTGAATVTGLLTDISSVTVQDYELTFDGANFTLAREDGASSVTAAGPTLTLDGFSLTVAGAAAAGDSFLVRPARAAAQAIGVAVSDPNAIAAAVPVRTEAALGNTGSGAISAGEVLDVTDANLLDTVQVRFNSGTDFDLLDANGAVLAAAQPYTPGADIDFNGWRVDIQGAPRAGDTFTVRSNQGGIADNRNMLLLGDLQSSGILDGGSSTYQEAYSTMVGSVGAQTRQARVNADAQQVLFDSVQARRDSLSGVNLDEEAAYLIFHQQAYQASARAIATADTVFQALLSAV